MDEITRKRLLELSRSWEAEARRWSRKAREFEAEGLFDNAELFRQGKAGAQDCAGVNVESGKGDTGPGC